MKKHPIHNIMVCESGIIFSLSKRLYMKELKAQETEKDVKIQVTTEQDPSWYIIV